VGAGVLSLVFRFGDRRLNLWRRGAMPRLAIPKLDLKSGSRLQSKAYCAAWAVRSESNSGVRENKMTWRSRFIPPALCALGAFVSTAALMGCAGDPNPGPGVTSGVGGSADVTGVGGALGAGGAGGAPSGLHVVTTGGAGPHIEDSTGRTITLRGINRSGTEYKCIQNGGVFDGPTTNALTQPDSTVAAMVTWKATAVRVPLNESCWLGINGAPAAYSGDVYKTAIMGYVAQLHRFNLVPILDLHWVGPGTTSATREQPMPDADHAPAFWADVASTFLADTGVVFEPYNEPFPGNNADSMPAWQCWQSGCTANQAVATGQPAATYQAVGMPALVSAIRGTGAAHLILVGGLEYSNDLSQWLTYAPVDSNMGAAWHVYNFNACNSATCWDGAPAGVAAMFPLVATEIGERDCMGIFIGPLMTWLDSHGGNYLAWSWDAFGACSPYVSQSQQGRPWSLVTDYDNGTPNGGYAQAFHDHVLGL
jgi:endoglucanase